MFCSKCGTQLAAGTGYCSKCGAPATAVPATVSAGAGHPQATQPPRAPAVTERDPGRADAAPGFFDLGEYVIDEKISAFKFTNAYKVFNAGGVQIGAVEQQKVSGGAKAARLLLGNNVKAMQAFRLDITDMGGAVMAGVERAGISSGMKGIRGIGIYGGSGQPIGSIKVLFSMLKPKMDILDPGGATIGRIQGDWIGWNFTITDANGVEVGAVNKKWAGAMKEIFTTADKYHVSISPRASGVHRVAIVAAAITIDMVLKETK